MSLEIKIPAFTLGWEFESVTDINGEGSNEDRDNCGDCEYCNGNDVDYSECENLNRGGGDRTMRSPLPSLIEVHTDASVDGAGLEYVLDKSCVKNPAKGLKALWYLLKKTEVSTDKTCGFHVHVGLPLRTTKSLLWAGWLQQLGALLEDDIFQIVPESRRSNSYCKSLKDRPLTPLSVKTYNPEKYANHDRYFWINTVEMFRPDGIKTVEFRLAGNMVRAHYLFAWVGLCRSLARSAWILSHDVSYLDKELTDLRRLIRKIKAVHSPRLTSQIQESCTHNNRLEDSYDLLRSTGIEMIEGHEIRPLSELRKVEHRLAYLIDTKEPSNSYGFTVGDFITAKFGAPYSFTVPGYLCQIVGMNGNKLKVRVAGHASCNSYDRFDVESCYFRAITSSDGFNIGEVANNQTTGVRI